MARLNEPPITGESLDSLKRRFIRQNREITRANSAQSIRIRSLECETSRLLSENITLREHNIQLQRQLESTGNRPSVTDRLNQIRNQLEAKLTELGGLVYELGTVDKKSRRSSAIQSGRPDGQIPKKSPDQRNWKNAFTLSDITGHQEGRLPPILEDKLYPRRTLESADIAGLIADAHDLTDSPEIGPPPIARFEDVISLRHDPKGEDDREDPASAPSSIARLDNLELRKKRRESSHAGSSLSDSVDVPCNVPKVLTTSTPTQPLKSGAKRKFSARDIDEPRDAVLAFDKDDFQFNKRAESTGYTLNQTGSSDCFAALATSPSKVPGSMTSFSQTKVAQEDPVPLTGTRKALGEKSVNKSPVKPKRAAFDAASDLKDAPKKSKHRQDDTSRSRPQVSKPQRPRKPDKSLNPKPSIVEAFPLILNDETTTEPHRESEVDLALPPIPPSPSTFAPSASATPHPPPNTPPTDLAGTRPSRRQRGSVSYAEPNLRDKMRRPTKDLVDAVGGDDKMNFQRSASVRAESETRKEMDSLTIIGERIVEPSRNAKTTAVKVEKDEDDSWKNLPFNSLTKHGEMNVGGEPPNSVEAENARPREVDVPSLESTGAEAEVDAVKKASGSSAAIAALAGPSRTKLNRAKATAIRSKASDSISELVPDLPDTENEILIPPAGPKASNAKQSRGISPAGSTMPRVVPLTSASRTSRRYSSVPDALGKDGAPRIAQSLSQDVPPRAGSVRRKETNATAKKIVGEEIGKIELRGGALVEGGGGGVSKGDREKERAERVASRRKSMMI